MTKVVLSGVQKGSSEQVLRVAVRSSVEAATDFSWLAKGDSVFVKPALNSGGEYPATTSPVALGTVVELLKEKGAGRVVVGDMSGIEHVKLSPRAVSGSSRRLMETSGMANAARQSGGELHFFEEDGWDAFYEDFPISGSHWKGPLMMPNILRSMDHIVLMPRCGRHALAGNTLGLKAAVGYWRTDTRLEYHRDAETFHEKTAEGNTVGTLVSKQRLVVSAADKILTTYGPDKGYVIQPSTGLVIVSESVVAHDMVSMAWLTLCRHETPISEINWLKDPHTCGPVVTMANRWIVSKLGGIVQAFKAETLTRNELDTIWNDRALNRAYQVLGGTPEIDITSGNEFLPEILKQRLAEMVSVEPDTQSVGIA